MAVSLAGAFSASTGSVVLTVVGTSWTTVPATVTISRQAPGAAVELVRGWIAKAVVGGYVVATDHEMPINSTLAYIITGYTAAGAVIESAQATVATTVTAKGVFVKAPGRPDLTVFCQPASLGEIGSVTIGGAYQILGGGSVAVALFGGAAPLTAQLVLRTDRGSASAALRALLEVARVVLVQPVGMDDLDPGWYFTAQASRSNPGGMDAFAFRYTTLALTAARVPAGESSGAVWTYAAMKATYATYAAAKAAYASYFAMTRGPS